MPRAADRCTIECMAVVERSAGFILFRVRPGGLPAAQRAEYLLLDYGGHWDFAKGHVEPGESDFAAAKRELAEETGITHIRPIAGFAHEMTYFFRHKSRGLIRKTVILFLARTDAAAVTLSHEHKGHAFEPIGPAIKRVTFSSARNILRTADEFLGAHPESI